VTTAPGGRVRAVDVLVHLATARFDRPLTYGIPDGPSAVVGEVVRVPLGPRELFGYVVSPERTVEPGSALRAIVARVDVPRAFDEEGLALARWVAETSLCSLRDALGAVVLADAIPRVVERIVPVGEAPDPARFPSVPERLVRLVWGDLREGFAPAVLLRHPEARRSGDRRTLLAAVGALVRAGLLERRRTFVRPSVSEREVRVLEPGDAEIRGRSAAALAAFVRERGSVARSDARLAGFSDAVVRRAAGAGAVRESFAPVERSRVRQVVLPDLVPTAEQAAAIAAVVDLLGSGYAQVLVHGTTGSGKTLVYLHAIARVVQSGGRAIVLVPEIALTPQTAARFTAVFGERVAVVHSALSERERFDAWQAAARGELDVVVGARSAIFAPLPDVRLIVVDEEHESSYRQDTVPRYHAVEVARERMRRAGGVVVLGSATPALDDYARARAGRFPLVALRYRATAQPLPETHVVDMAREFEAGSRHVFASSLVEAIGERLRRGEKTVLFVNRRGAARFVLCRACGAVPGCTRCSTGLVLHREEGLLRCHYCDAQRPVPQQCPACGDGPVLPFGVGTQRVVEDLAQLYPAARIVRMDSDSTTRIGDHARLLERFGRDGDVLVGTQMVAKGLDFPEVTLVGVLAADADLHVADYRAAERTFDVIVQVCGRSGRAREGEAIVQTYAPEHPAIACAARHDYETFARLELAERRAARWPPFVHLAFVGAIGRDRTAAQAAIERYAGVLRDDPRWDVLGPAPYPIERLNDEWRYRIAIKTRDLAPLRAALRAHVLPLAAREKRSRLAVVFEG
jgi:primosomal protein N' (replication factor Y) (superfamily II helicase)